HRGNRSHHERRANEGAAWTTCALPVAACARLTVCRTGLVGAKGGAMRTVVILAGPPGAGKTTLAHQSGMQVYDQDDPKWASVQHFNQALATLREHPAATAVVIRSGATTSARRKAATAVGATHTYLFDPGQDI